MSRLPILTAGALAIATTAGGVLAQGEEKHLPFQPAAQAFEEAARTGKRVLVYQDWPG